ncbi:MAG: CaiB/BaiF CoA transferase family protein [Gammaproteobacteria bacterium]
MTGPLDGFRVVDLSAMVSGPVATMMLADQGAEVIKVEPLQGEYMRRAGVQHAGMSSSFLSCNRGKRSLSVDLKTDAGIAIVLKLVQRADVFVQNFRPGAIERMGLGEEAVRKLAPTIVYVSISGFGEAGPYALQRVYDPIIQALSGLADVQRDRATGQPHMVRTIVPDKTTSVTAAQAITAALLHRERKGEGQHVRLAMLDTMVAYLWPESMSGLNFVGNEVDPARAQMGLDLIFQTLDGHITAATVADAEWHGFCRAIGRNDLVEDARFATARARQENQAARRQLMSDELARWSSAEILARLKDEDVPCAPIVERTALLENEQIVCNRLVEEHADPVLGRVRQPRPAARFSRTPSRVRSLAPFLGADNDRILSELGYSEEETERLHADRIVRTEVPPNRT